MIKKAGVWILALLYLVTATGVALSFHYCCDNLDTVKINAPAASQKMLACKNKCCKDKHLEIKVKDVHQAQLSAYFDKLFAVQLPTLFFADFLHAFRPALLVTLSSKDPPDSAPGRSVTFIKNRVFRI